MALSRLFIASLMFALLGCSTLRPQQASPPPKPGEEEAEAALRKFFLLLHDARYQEAVELYGGSYDTMRDHNPSVDPADRAALMRNACEINGAMCLEVKAVRPEGAGSEGSFVFQVEFADPDGSLFIREACCGASPTEQPPESVFQYTVEKTPHGSYVVSDMPPYYP